MNTTRVLRKQTYNMVTRTRPRSTAKTSLMSKVPSKINNFEGLEKSLSHVFPDFPLEKTSTPHQTSTENDPQNIVTHRIWQTTIRHTYRHSPYLTPQKKGQIPTLNLPSFQNNFLISIFFQIWRFSFWRLFSVGDLIARFERFVTSRPEIRSDSGSDSPLTALTTPMI